MATSISSLLPMRQSSIMCAKHIQGFLHKNIKRLVLLTSSRCKSYQAFQTSPQDELFSPLDPCELASKKKYRLAGIKYLPDSDCKEFPEFLANPRQGLPQAYKIQHADQFSISEWAQHCRKLLDEQLPKYGVVFFRGLPLSNEEHFTLFSNALGYTAIGYEGGTTVKPNYGKAKSTFISSVEDKAYTMEPHSDMTYWPVYPSKVIFYCDVAPEEGTGGLTPITKISEVMERLDPKLVQKCEEKKIRYHRYLHNGKGYLPWQVTFRTDDRKEVEKYLEANKLSYKWHEDDSLSYWLNLPAIIRHPVTGEKVWFNQYDSHHCTYIKHHSSPMLKELTFESDFHYPTHTTYGDGTDLEPEMLQHIRAIKWQCSVGVQWKRTDMIVFDNLKVMHGRMSYTGERRLLAYICRD
ncbi:uncharacterized protein LOC116301635 [Actinia tenebrosa]|uniref:Uncharacterized protein LOC116301635 n=1 Tax=Actinia tenebrosa TaxID=6105 RepID=A0A6P8IIL5_ACTTE|nr:uncharacterized protein LOC116301635 [Actinia tenebrosa]